MRSRQLPTPLRSPRCGNRNLHQSPTPCAPRRAGLERVARGQLPAPRSARLVTFVFDGAPTMHVLENRLRVDFRSLIAELHEERSSEQALLTVHRHHARPVHHETQPASPAGRGRSHVLSRGQRTATGHCLPPVGRKLRGSGGHDGYQYGTVNHQRQIRRLAWNCRHGLPPPDG